MTLSKQIFDMEAWVIPKQENAPSPQNVWTNADMDPTPPEHQTWSTWTIMAYWMSDIMNLATWQVASGVLALGLSWREAIPCMVVGTCCIAVPMVLNGAIGTHLHVPYAVITVSSFGYKLRYFCVVIRAVLAMFWFGIQGVNGAQCVTIMLRAIAPSYNNIPNVLPVSAGIDSKGLCSYLLFSIIQLPFLLVHPTKLRPIFWLKLLCSPVAAFATLGWCIHKAGGTGQIFLLRAEASGSQYSFLWLTGMTAITGSWATIACNIPDFTRYARSTSGQYVQLPFLPTAFTLCGTLGVITTSAAKVFTGNYVWNPLDIITLWLDGGAGGRAAAFFVALAWYLAQVGTNITTNTISAANDLAVMFPRWINIKRGSMLTALLGGWAFAPWKVLASATSFIAFMGGCSGMHIALSWHHDEPGSLGRATFANKSLTVFLAPISGIMVADYWLVKKRHYDVSALYNPCGQYRFTGGYNWRAAVAFLLSVAPLLPGLASSISGPSMVHIPAGVRYLYSVNWLFGFLVSIALYTIISTIFPDQDL